MKNELNPQEKIGVLTITRQLAQLENQKAQLERLQLQASANLNELCAKILSDHSLPSPEFIVDVFGLEIVKANKEGNADGRRIRNRGGKGTVGVTGKA